jgi:uncharacterized protein DUF4440
MVRLSFAVFAVAMLIYGVALADPAPTVSGAPEYHLREAPKTSAELTAAIARADADLFDAVFIQCDPDKVGTMITDDFRFLHDKDGLSETSKAHFVADLRGACERQAKGTDFRARRELVPGSLQVWPIDKYGALETGMHNFYARIPGKPDTLTESGNFIIVWKLEGGTWLMSETISYGHTLAK